MPTLSDACLDRLGEANWRLQSLSLKAAGSLSPVLMALVSSKPGGPVPVQLNRHAAHAAGPEQCSDVNAVIALMLTTSVLRQAPALGW